jgi:MFS transporter, FSR family, fosmidomycin resistance protein
VLAERLGVLRTIIITEVATGVGILLTLALPAVATFVLLPLIGVVLQGTSSVIYGTIGDLVEQDRLPRAFAMVYTVGACCGIVAPLAYGLLGDAIGIEKTIAVVGGFVLLALPLCLVLRPSLRLSGSAST